MDSATWEKIRKTGKGKELLSSAKLSPALVQLKWSSLTKSDRTKLEQAAKGKGFFEAKKPVATKRGIESKAPIHRQVAIRKSLESTLRKPLEPVKVPEPEPIQLPEPEKPVPVPVAHELKPLPTKLPWQMTQKEYIDFRTEKEGAFDFGFKDFHESYIKDALKDGKPIPAIVLQDYPHLLPQKEVPTIVPEPKSERKVSQENIYKERIRSSLESLGTLVATEWKATDYVYNDKGETCQLCGHGITNVYILTKTTGENIGRTLHVGSECVVNYLGIPINKVDFDLKFNKDGRFKERLKHTQENIGRLASPANKDYQSRTHWADKKPIIDTYVNELTAQDFLTEGKGDKVIELHMKSEEELNRLRASMEDASKEHDELAKIMEESKPFHSNKFIRSVYTQWASGRNLSEKQKSSFIDAVNRMKSAPVSEEPIGKNTVKGILSNFMEGFVNTKRGSKQKLTFDVLPIIQISVVEWIKGFEDVKNIRNSGKPVEAEVTYNYDGRYRNLLDNGIVTGEKIQMLPDAPEMDVDFTRFLPIIPRAWQTDCFKRWFLHKDGGGIIKVGTGGGKTIFGIMCEKYLLFDNPNLTILISVPTVILQKQWKEEMMKMGIDGSIIGFVGGEGGQEITTQIVVAIINSIRNRELLDIFGKPFDLFIGDESHHLSLEAAENSSIIENNEFGRMLLFSATPGEELEMAHPTVCIVTEDELIEEGSLVKSILTNIAIDLPPSDMAIYDELTYKAIRAGGMDSLGGKNYYGQRSRFLQNHPLKVKKAIELIKEIQGQLDRAIVFFTTIKAVEEFNEMMNSMGISSVAYHSKMTDEKKTYNLAKFSEGGAKLLIGALALSEGLNIVEVDVTIIVGSDSKKRSFIQKTGRAKRAAAGKDTAYIYQIYARNTVEEQYLINRMETLPKGTEIINR